MTLKPMDWGGEAFALRIRRHWYTFFDLATIFEIRTLRMTKILPAGAGYHIMELHALVNGARSYFNTFDNFWFYSRRLCDQYCDFYVMERPREGNTFSEFHSTYLNDRSAVRDFAKASQGYIGPADWKLT
jgi:hypothetical protein